MDHRLDRWNLSRCDRSCLRSRHLARTTARIAANHQPVGERASVLDCAIPPRPAIIPLGAGRMTLLTAIHFTNH